MRSFMFLLMIAVSAAAGLDNTYLPPSEKSHESNFRNPYRQYSSSGSESSIIGSTSFAESKGSQTIPGPTAFETFKSSASTVSSHGRRPVDILRYTNDNYGDGNYNFEYETENNIRQHEKGHLERLGGQEAAVVVQGSYSYTSPEGKVITVNYVADENGFQAIGDHLPTPHPIPEAILKSLQYNAAHGASEYSDGNDGQYNSVEANKRHYSSQEENIQDFPLKNAPYNHHNGYRKRQRCMLNRDC